MKRLLLSFLLSTPLLAKSPSCPQIDFSKKDNDGVAFCPSAVTENSAYAVTRCAFEQAKKWHPATAAEQKLMRELVQGFKDENIVSIVAKADALRLQVCRVKSANDSYLLLYTKPKVQDYSGPFLMYREGGKTSGLLIQSPHDGQDGTHVSTKLAFQKSNALAMISNGHPRRISGKGPDGHHYPSDWAHSRQDNGWFAIIAFRDIFPQSIHLHLHGLAADKIMVTDSVGWDDKHELRGAFIAAANKALEDRPKFIVEAWRFNGWEPGWAMTMGPNDQGRKQNNRYVGAEISVKLHSGLFFLPKLINNLETDYLHKGK